MRRRFFVTLGVLLLFLLPGLPPARNALLRWGASFAARAGYTVTYRESGGNPFYRLSLDGLNIKGPGVNASVQTLRLGYTLPALVTGKLPLRTEIVGVRGSLNLAKVAQPAPATPNTPTPAAQPRSWFRPILEQADVSDVALDVSGAPFAIPDVKLTRLEVTETGETFNFSTALAVQNTVQNAVLKASGTATLEPFTLGVAVQQADVALAQGYFDGLKGGTLSGTVKADAAGVTGDLELDGGQVDLVGLELSRVSGPLTVRDQKLTTELIGQALGGPLEGTATVDLAAQHWQVDVTGDAALTDALVWLGQGRSQNLVDDVLEPSGNADVSLKVGGWQTFTLSGQATGQGKLLGEPLRDLNVDFGFESAVGTEVGATATLGGEPFRFALTPQGEGFGLTASGQNLPLRGFSGDVNVDLASQQGNLTGTSDLELKGQLLGRSTTVKAEAQTDGRSWQVDLSGNDERGADLTGGLTLDGNVLNGTARVRKLALPGFADPVTVIAEADGPISTLPLTLRIAGPQGAHPAAGGVRAEADFSGQAAATLENGTLTGITGDFGPLEASGTLNDLRYALSPTALSGRATGTVALQNGRLSRQNGLSTTAQLVTQDLRGAGVTLPDLNAKVNLSQADGLAASVTDKKAGVDVKVQNGALTGTLNNARIGALGETFAANGTVSGQTAQLVKTLDLDVRAKTTGDSPGTTVRAVGNAQNTKLSVNSKQGATLAGRTLDGANLSGNASLTEQRADLSGTLGGVDVAVSAKPDATGQVRTEANLTGGGENFTARFDSLRSWSTDGTLPLGELGQALGLPLSGTVKTNLARQGAAFSGRATAQGTAFGLPFEAEATSQGDKLNLGASSGALSGLLGQPLTLSGTALPETDATLQLGDLGAVQVRGQYPKLTLVGSGQVPGVSRAGLELLPQSWQLNGNLARGQADLRIGQSRVTARQGENGWTLNAQLEQHATLRGETVNLTADLTRSPQNPDGRVRGTLTLGGAPLELAGTLRDLKLNGTVPAETLQPGLLGQVRLGVQVDAFTQAYEVRSSWRRGGPGALSLNVTGKRAEVTATVQGTGLEARFDTTTETPNWRVQVDKFALARLPVAALRNLEARADGTLGSSSGGFEGRLRFTVGNATAQLTGQGRRLNLTADFEQGALQANATGSLVPDLNIVLNADTGGAATLRGTVKGMLGQPRLDGRVTTAAQNLAGGQFALPAQQLGLAASLSGGLNVSLTGDTVDARLQNGMWDGTVSLPFGLRNAPHRLSGTLQGALAQPVLNAEVDGKTVTGPLTLSRAGLDGTLNLTPGLGALPDARVQAAVTASPDLSWRADLDGAATLPYRDLQATLTGQVSGRGVQYDGAADLNVAGQKVPLTVAGEAGRVQAEADFEAVDLSAFAPATGTVSGSARFATAEDGLHYFADLEAQGQTAGQPFDLTLGAEQGALELTGTVAGASVRAEGSSPLETLTVRAADSQRPLELTSTLGFGETLTLRGEGAWQGEKLALDGTYTPNRGDGNLRVALADAVLEGSVTQTRTGPQADPQTGRTVNATLAAPTGLLGLETPLSASVKAVQREQAITISAFTARSGENTLSLSGTVPGIGAQAALLGTLNVPAAGDPVALKLNGLETGYLASLTQNELVLRSVLSPSFRPERVRLVGTLKRAALGLESDLVWQQGAGFSGRADATLNPGKADVTLTLLGQEQLQLRGAASYKNVNVADLSATLSADPWRDRNLDGTLDVSAPVAQLSPVWVGDPLALNGSLALSGSLSAPELRGPVALRGALTVDGTVKADRQGARLSVSGDGLRGVAAVDAKGYRATLNMTKLGLGGLLPTLAPTLSAALRATQTWGRTPAAQLSDVRFESGRSRVIGQLRFNGGLAGSLELDTRLSDFVSGWQGRVQGPVFVSSGAPLSGTLRLRGLGPKAASWQLGGQTDLSGTLANPVFDLALRGQGSADGTLQATAAPRRGRLELTSTLALLGAETDFALTRTKASISAAGTLAYRDFRTVLETQGSVVELSGQAKLAGWRGTYDPARFSLSGPLESLSPQLTGKLELGGAADLGTLSGTLTDVALGPVKVGNASLERGEGSLELRGDAVNAQVGLSGVLPWTLTRLNLTGPGSSTLTLSGKGTRTQGQVKGQLETANLELPLQARYAPEGLALTAEGKLPVGDLEIEARHRDRWRGQVTVTEGQTRVFVGQLTGELTSPTLAGDLALTRSGGSVQGTFQVGRDALEFSTQVTSPQLASPLRVTGSGWPLTLQLAAPGSEGAQTLNLALEGGRLEPSGALALGVGPARVALRAGGDAGRRLVLQLSAPAAPGFTLRTTLPAVLSEYAALVDGVTFRGAEKTSGSLTVSVRPNPRVSAQNLRWRTAAGNLTLSGRGTLTDPSPDTPTDPVIERLSADLTGRWVGTSAAPVPWLRTAVPFRAQVSDGQLDVTSAKLGRLRAQYGGVQGDSAENNGEQGNNEQNFALQSELTLGRGRLTANLGYTRAEGLTGTMSADALPVFSVGQTVATLTSQLTLGEAGVSGNGALELSGGQLNLSGFAGWARLLPEPLARFTPSGTEALSAQLRLSRFDLGGVPQIAARLPHLSAPVSGVATLSGTQIVGQLVAPELRVLANTLPTQVDFNGTLTALEARALVGDSRLNVRYNRSNTGSETGPNAGPTVAGLVTLEGFPLQALPEAVVGASQVEATLTGAARFDLPLRRLETGYVRLATEQLTLKSTGPNSTNKLTRGDVAVRFENGSLYVERAEFRGDGFWRARGVLTPENLDFTVEAQDADFTPLLRLVPPLAALNVGAQGSLDVQAVGSAAAPDITLQSPNIDLNIAGSRYRIVDTEASLSGGAFGLSGALLGVSPVTGRLELTGSGQVNLAPFVTTGLALRFGGGVTVPTLGRVSGIQGRIYPSDAGWQLDSRGTLGRPFRVAGSLAPLELSITGQALDVQARRLFLASSSTDVDLLLQARNGVFTFSGDAFVRQAQLSLNRGETAPATAQNGETQPAEESPPDPTPTTPAGTPEPNTAGSAGTDANLNTALAVTSLSADSLNPSSSGAEDLSGTGLGVQGLDAAGSGIPEAGVADPGVTGSDTENSAVGDLEAAGSGEGLSLALDAASGAAASVERAVSRSTNPVLARIRFNNVTLTAPREVFFNEAFGNAELGFDLTLSGTAARPLLDGQAGTLGGSIRFSGQDFSLSKAVATFDAARGVYPTLALEATTSYDTRTVGGTGEQNQVQIVEPTTPTFEVQLQINGGFEESRTGRQVLDLAPTLSSNAQLQEANSSGTRPLSEGELVSLLTLGRLQLDAAFGSSNSLVGTVAESALDTAVDLLLVSELQDALNDVIGADLLEIRTSAFSSILGTETDGSQPNFGVSVKLGGYLSDNLFASVQVGRFDDPEQNYALSNEFLLRYTAAPLELNLTGGVNFLDRAVLSAATDFSLGLSYAITPLISLEASLDTTTSLDTNAPLGTTARQRDTSIGFGVSFTW